MKLINFENFWAGCSKVSIAIYGVGFLLSQTLHAQSDLGKPKPTPTFKTGIGMMAPDSSFSINFRFRMQNRFLMATQSTEDLSPEQWEARVRRTRLSLTGHVYNPALTYYVQFSFSKGDMDWNMNDVSAINNSPNTVRDAMIFYRVSPKLQLGFGQGKLPGNRQRVVSSGALQFYDRSIVNAQLTLDRDFGLFVNYTFMGKKTPLILKGAITSGEGRNSSTSTSGLAYTARIEFLPLGVFSDGGDYFEGDLSREARPKISLAGGYHYNDMSLRTQGQLGRDLYNPISFETYFADAVIKFKGVSASFEYMKRNSANNPITTNVAGNERYLVVANGINYQLSYCTKKMWEFAGRYSVVKPDNRIQKQMNQMEQSGLGVSKYLNKHKVKCQFNLFYNKDHNMVSHKLTENFFSVFQVELGI